MKQKKKINNVKNLNLNNNSINIFCLIALKSLIKLSSSFASNKYPIVLFLSFKINKNKFFELEAIFKYSIIKFLLN